MKINLEILKANYLIDKSSIDNLNTKELVPNMMIRRRLTKASKLVIELINNVGTYNGRILYGSSFGELEITAKILNNILNKEAISPTDFQNSVYNTAVSYASILQKNENEILTISSGNETGDKLLKAAAIKSLDNDEILIIAAESLNIKNIEEINKCIDYLECAVALKVKVSKEMKNLDFDDSNESKLPLSLIKLINIAKQFDETKKNIIEVNI